jgi:RNA polymerase sigma-70 factor, ECF subfamily
VTTVTMPRSDEALARCLRGDAASFADVVRDHQSMVFSIAYHLLHDRGLAEEVAQDVFLRLHRHLAAIKSADHLVFWLRQVTCRCAIDEARKLPKVPPASLDDIVEPARASPDPDPLLFEGLRRMVASLPEDARAIIILRFQEELHVVEIAKILGLPINTVKSRLQRSLELLRDKVSRWAGDVQL